MSSFLNVLRYIIFMIIAMIISVHQSSASTVEFQMDFEFSGGTEPAGFRPWATASFIDTNPNTIRMTMSAINLSDTEFISRWSFNFDPILDPELLIFTAIGTPGSTPNSINTGTNAFKAGPDKFYDIEFDFPPPKGNYDNKFTAGETVVYDITYKGSGTINSSLFDFESDLGHDGYSYHSAAHIQGIGGNKSGWVGDSGVAPEPVSTLLFLAGGITLGIWHIRKAKKESSSLPESSRNNT